jgi:hypothetical protein
MSFFEDFDDESSGGSDSSTLGDIVSAGVTLGSTAILASANPTNVALLQGQAVQTPALITSGSPVVSGMSGLFWLLVIGGLIVVIMAIRR